ncbi:hypothetical protein MPSEU_000010600 [Mayamaea pseudoterrestris]|nr:hypothetical protein MPSEU_000010600 [Mayamaea pseudoterrestris]
MANLRELSQQLPFKSRNVSVRILSLPLLLGYSLWRIRYHLSASHVGSSYLPTTFVEWSGRVEPQFSLTSTSPIPLRELAETYKETTCPPNLYLIQDKFEIDSKFVYNRTIPRIIHVTGKTRCLSPPFISSLQRHWRKYSDHIFVFYNDQAVDRLLSKHFPAFPHMQQVLNCLRGGAAKADLFRAVVLWEYGGIYTDMDNAANAFNASSTITDDDEAFFVIEGGRFLSQFFMAARPKHPLIYLLIQHTLSRLLTLNEVDLAYAPFVTGPGALKNAFVHYMGSQGPNEPNNARHYTRYHNPDQEGVYYGVIGNSSVTVKGSPGNHSLYIQRDGIAGKFGQYATMNMTHFSQMGATGNQDSCVNRIYLRQVAQEGVDMAALASW